MKNIPPQASLPHALNAEYIEAQYQMWRNNPESVPSDWQFFFQGFELASNTETDTDRGVNRQSDIKQIQVERLINRYREIGHLLACLDPLAECLLDHPLLEVERFGLSEADLERNFPTGDLPLPERAPLKDIIEALKMTYSHSVGVEYTHLQDPDERQWLCQQMESQQNRPLLDNKEKQRILHKLYEVQHFENFLNKKYPGQTRFSLEGADVIVPLLDVLIDHVAQNGVQEIILGMAHRGRLSVLTGNLEKPYEAIFTEFENSYTPDTIFGAGDVKYHKGYLAKLTTQDNLPIEILLVSNSSHLESVNPIVEGIARARQERREIDGHNAVLPLLLHGDAAFAGQGITAETLNISQLEGYTTGGTFHIVINNQIGYTTLPQDARSTRYATDIAKMLMIPVFHVHGEDPESVAHIARLAFDYRRRFNKDVVIDVICYRRYGHNEGDEPYFTQPAMYNRIKSRPPLVDIYTEKLTDEGIVTPPDIDRMSAAIFACLEEAYGNVQSQSTPYPQMCFYEGCEDFNQKSAKASVSTSVSKKRLTALGRKLTEIPENFNLHPKLERLFKNRSDLIVKGSGIDWATAESLAFGSLLTEGVPVRLSGQDCRRGTFSQRHSVLVDIKNENRFTPLNHLTAPNKQARFMVYDSSLSEAGILGFEYGYSLVNLNGLTLWEAQFGDFANNAQAVIDLYITGGESRWQILSGLVLLLPHGYEGLGAEHSSARIERFLQLCAEENLCVCYPSTPAQYFHLLRRQVLAKIRKPLIIMTPKSLLRNPLAVSDLAAFTGGTFETVITDNAIDPSKISRVILCTGKLFYELADQRQALNHVQTALVRIEQLYPFPQEKVAEMARIYKKARNWFWVQEEPENMGAWRFFKPLLESSVQQQINYIGRNASASNATGISPISKKEQATLIAQAFEVDL